MLKHNYPVTYWGHLQLVEKKEDKQGFHIDGKTISFPDLRKEWKAATLKEWDAEWQTNTKGAWTHTLLPRIKTCLQLNITPSFWTSQALTGHGVFGQYLLSRNHCITSMCSCGDSNETLEHVFKHCILFTTARPMSWDNLTPQHVQYLRNTTRKLWEIENPHFHSRKPKT